MSERDVYEQQLLRLVNSRAQGMITPGGNGDMYANLGGIDSAAKSYGEWRAARAVAEAGCYGWWMPETGMADDVTHADCAEMHRLYPVAAATVCPSCSASAKLDAMMGEAK